MNPYFMFILVCLFLVACGKKGPVEPLEESEYPRTYPKPVNQDSFPPHEDSNDDA